MKHKTPTGKDIKAEIAKLKDLKPKVRHFTAFDEDNRAAIGVQIDCLEESWDEDDLRQRHQDEDINDFEADNARDVLNWLEGEAEAPSKDWADLVENKG